MVMNAEECFEHPRLGARAHSAAVAGSDDKMTPSASLSKCGMPQASMRPISSKV